MPRQKRKTSSISIFNGREAKLNKAVLYILALKGSLTIYEISREVKAKRGLKHTKYTNVNRRVRILEKCGYVEKVGTRKTQAGFQAALYQLTARAYIAILLNEVSLDDLIQKANEENTITILAALIIHMSMLENPSNWSF